MSIHVFFSQHVESLADRLADSIAADLALPGADPFASTAVVVPNTNLKKWLQLQVARRLGIAVNLEFDFLENAFWRGLDALTGHALDCERLSREQLRFALLGLLLEPDRTYAGGVAPSGHSEPDTIAAVAPLRRYLRAASGPGDYSRRAWQLCGNLAGYFLEYESQREAMVTAWCADETHLPATHPAIHEMELSQKHLYRAALHALGSRATPHTTTFRQFAELALQRLQDGPPPPEDSRAPLHIFGLSQISPFHARMLYELARYCHLRVYELNVCSEFWEDVSTPWEDRWERIRAIRERPPTDGVFSDPEALLLEPSPADNALLKLWGKLGREKVKLLSELEERSTERIQFVADWVGVRPDADTTPATVLQAVQADVLHRSTGDQPRRIAQDTSIQIVGCPGIYREVETVYNSIIANMLDDPDLKLTDIAILVTDMAKYKPVLAAVFGRSPRHIAYNLVDSNAARDSVYAQAVCTMLALAESALTRREVFETLLNPCFLAGTRLVRTDVDRWLEWASALNIVHSEDAAHKRAQGYGASDRFTWHQGLRRLRLGRIMEQTAAGDGPTAQHFMGVAPFGAGSADSEEQSQLALVLETLFARLRRLRGRRLPPSAWSRELSGLFRTYLDVPEDRPQEQVVRRAVDALLENLPALDAALSVQHADATVGLPFVAEYVRAGIGDIPSGYGRYLTGGVTISALRPMRPIPFGVTYVMGLGEGAFPGSPQTSLLDLRMARRRLGDVNVADQNRYLFLETLMSTRRKLYLTYNAHDTLDDKRYHPCSVVNELRRYIEDTILPPAGVPAGRSPENQPETPPRSKAARPSFRIAQAPLNRYSRAFVLEQDPQQRRWSDTQTTFAVQDVELALELLARERSTAGQHAAAVLHQRHTTHADATHTPPQDTAPTADATVTLAALRAFLLDPAEALLRRRIGLYPEDDDAPELVECEPFASEGLERYHHVVDALTQVVLSDDDEWRTCVATAYEQWQRESRTPDGLFARMDRAELDRQLGAIMDGTPARAGLGALLRRLRTQSHFVPAVCIGSGAAPDADVLAFPALHVAVSRSDSPVALSGQLPLVWRGDGGGTDVLVLAGAACPPGQRPKHLLMPFLFYACARASQQADASGRSAGQFVADGAFRVHVAYADGVRHWTFDLKPPEAEHYVTSLVSAYLDPEPSYDLLPYSPVMQLDHDPDPLAADDDDSAPPDSTSAAYREALREHVAAAGANARDYAYAPDPIVDLLNLDVPGNAFAIVRNRLGPLVACSAEADEGAP